MKHLTTGILEEYSRTHLTLWKRWRCRFHLAHCARCRVALDKINEEEAMLSKFRSSIQKYDQLLSKTDGKQPKP